MLVAPIREVDLVFRLGDELAGLRNFTNLATRTHYALGS
jgi:hypothetical protein